MSGTLKSFGLLRDMGAMGRGLRPVISGFLIALFLYYSLLTTHSARLTPCSWLNHSSPITPCSSLLATNHPPPLLGRLLRVEELPCQRLAQLGLPYTRRPYEKEHTLRALPRL